VYFNKFPDSIAKFEFKDRTKKIPATMDFKLRLDEELDELCKLRFTEPELDFIFNLRYLKNKLGFKEYLRLFQLNRKLIHTDIQDGELMIYTDEASILQTTMFEIYVLAIVNELYMNGKYPCSPSLEMDNTIQQYKSDANFNFVEFGTRRRMSREYQDELVSRLCRLPNFGGTSNVYLAMKYNLKCIGTMAHEYLCLGQALPDVPVAQSQKYMFEVWAKFFDGDLGIALSDNLGTDKFLKDFTPYLAKLFDGLRHDSGDPYEWGNRMIKMYQDYGIDFRTKTLLFSDGLGYADGREIEDYFRAKGIKAFACIGTKLTNPFHPTNIVMKVTSANFRPVAKLSEEPGKTMCKDAEYLEYLKYAIKH
jgi:nicotinate phosphoribosyltransferase